MVSIYCRSIDGWDETIDFNTKLEALEFMYKYLGRTFDRGSSYYINMYGDVTISMIEGMNSDDYENWVHTPAEANRRTTT